MFNLIDFNITIMVNDMSKSISLYIDVLGFKISIGFTLSDFTAVKTRLDESDLQSNERNEMGGSYIPFNDLRVSFALPNFSNQVKEFLQLAS
jgi:catechol 2,3-dioxygenase-like lactoylglutathione lyase family enzyme